MLLTATSCHGDQPDPTQLPTIHQDSFITELQGGRRKLNRVSGFKPTTFSYVCMWEPKLHPLWWMTPLPPHPHPMASWEICERECWKTTAQIRCEAAKKKGGKVRREEGEEDMRREGRNRDKQGKGRKRTERERISVWSENKEIKEREEEQKRKGGGKTEVRNRRLVQEEDKRRKERRKAGWREVTAAVCRLLLF